MLFGYKNDLHCHNNTLKNAYNINFAFFWSSSMKKKETKSKRWSNEENYSWVANANKHM